uniref:Protein lap4 n=1 Tax=Aceria tosichella TaxID=561515 RepID=A0A6G1SEH5_9ACAR
MKCISIFKCNPQIEVIDKSHCSLEDVPNFQNYSRSLEELFLDANKLITLNDNVFKLTKLRRFSFSDNAIQDIPPDIAKLVNLVELDGSRNKIQAIPEQIKFLRGLQICDFSANTIEYLPPGLVQLKNLTCLTLNYCILKCLPDDFGLLKSLEALELRENELESLPPSISGLENLRKLDVGRNLISQLPDDIGRLTKLEYLLVDGNRLDSVPAKIGRLENLQCLDLGQQEFGLKSLPDAISGLVNLTDLHLSENHLHSLPDGIKNLKNLTIFKADNNYLTELNPNIGGCVSLQELVLTSNQISKLPSSIGYLTDLRSLNVDGNLLRELPNQIGNLRSMGILSLRDNFLTHLPNEIGNLELIKVMDLSGNRLEYLPVSITNLNLKALWLSKNQAQPLPKLQIDELSQGTKVLTCYLLPQQNEDSDGSMLEHNDQQVEQENFTGTRQAAVSFDTAAVDDVDLDGDANFVRHDTPHPRELKARHQKLLSNTGKVVEMKGHDNASFVLTDNSNMLNNNNRDYDSRQPQITRPAYQHYDYDSNGLPEIDTTAQTRPQAGHVQTTSKLFEAFRQKSSDYPAKYDRDDSREPNLSSHENGYNSKNQATDSLRKLGDDPSLQWQVMDILVRRADHHKPGLGLSIAGGKDTPPFKDNDEGIFVSKVTRGGPAEAAGVKMGDKILAVNDHLFYEGITHQKAVEIFKKIRPDFREFSIRILRDPNDEFIDDRQEDGDGASLRGETAMNNNDRIVDKSFNQSTFTRTYTVPIKSDSNGPPNSVNNLKQFLMKDNQDKTTKPNASTLPPGMSLTDGAVSRNNIIYTTLVKDYKHDLGLVFENRNDDNDSKSTWSNIVISDIKPNSIASRDGKLQVDDRLLSINGADVTGIDLDRIMLMLAGTDRFIRIVVSRGDSDDPLGVALRNMPTRPSLGSWFSSTSNMSHRPSLIESYQRPTFGSVSSLQKQGSVKYSPEGAQQLTGGAKPQKPPKPAHLTSKDLEESGDQAEDNPIARPRNRGTGSVLSSSMSQQEQSNNQMSDAEKRAAWRRDRLKSIEDDVEMAKLLAEVQRRRREDIAVATTGSRDDK